VKILLEARKFFCRNERCRRHIFTEPLPETVARYARRSCRSSEALSWVTLALGGRAGARLARNLGLLASGSICICCPAVLGVDGWAWKKGIATEPFPNTDFQALYNASPQIAAMARTARQYFEMIRTREDIAVL
jgi:hypothetical protein